MANGEDNLFLLNLRGDKERLGLQVGDEAFEINDAIPSLDWLLRNVQISDITRRLLNARGQRLTLDERELRPIAGHQEVWAAGVTYKRSEEAREQELHNSTVYTRVYRAERPEVFFKAMGYDVVGNGQNVGIRYDAKWSVPEPELVVLFNPRMEVVGFAVGNDMSSRDIEGENPLELPQAKVYDQSCAVGSRLWLQPGATVWPDLAIQLKVRRSGAIIFEGETSSSKLNRPLLELADYLGRCKKFVNGALLFSGTGIVPPDDFTLAEGDEVTIRIDPMGELVNPVAVVKVKH